MTEMTNPILSERVQRRVKRWVKRGLHWLSPRIGEPNPIFVLGYGRSGTTMIIDALEHDYRIDVYQENDVRISRDFMLVRENVVQELERNRAPITMMKPILNSFEAVSLLGMHRNAKVLWMIRGVDPVVRSALKKFGSDVAGYLKNAVDGKDDGSWIARTIPEERLRTIRTLDTAHLSITDWMALVWWSVNRTLLEPDIGASDRVLLVQYEALLASPENVMRAVYDHIGLPYRTASTDWIGAGSPNPPQMVELSNAVRSLCDELSVDLKDLACNLRL